MICGSPRRSLFFLLCLALPSAGLPGQSKAQSPTPSSAKPLKPASANSALDPGSVTNGVYHNKTLALTCKIPAGWVLRTDELNARGEKNEEEKKEEQNEDDKKTEEKDAVPTPAASSAGAKVLLAAFSRP